MLVPVPINARCSTPNSSADDVGDLNSLSVKRYRFASCFLTCDWISRGLTCQTFADIKIASNAIIYFTEKEKKKNVYIDAFLPQQINSFKLSLFFILFLLTVDFSPYDVAMIRLCDTLRG